LLSVRAHAGTGAWPLVLARRDATCGVPPAPRRDEQQRARLLGKYTRHARETELLFVRWQEEKEKENEKEEENEKDEAEKEKA
jgi:hypothetical protein